VGGQPHAPAALPSRNRPGTHENGWAPGPVWTGAELLAPIPGFDPWSVDMGLSCCHEYGTEIIVKVISYRKPRVQENAKYLSSSIFRAKD
jgi:hypothetical protein